jgi:hypothetical protein
MSEKFNEYEPMKPSVTDPERITKVEKEESSGLSFGGEFLSKEAEKAGKRRLEERLKDGPLFPPKNMN